MKKTKAVLAILMAGTMMLGLAGCGGNSSSATQGTTQAQRQAVQQVMLQEQMPQQAHQT